MHRVWQEAKLSLPLRRPRKKRALASALTCSQAVRPNHVWTYDFVFDRCANGQQIKLLPVVDEYTRESLAIHVATSSKSRAVIGLLSRLVAERGAPRCLRSDNVLPTNASLSQRQSSPMHSGFRCSSYL
jgi:putative transposase